MELAGRLREAGGTGLVAVMARVNSPDPETLRRHFDALHDGRGLPVVVQDYPVASGVSIRPEALAALVSRCPYVAAIKCEAPPTAVAISILARSVRVPLFGGLGGAGLIDELAAGAAGAMTGFSYPEGLIAAVRAYRSGGFAAARDAFGPWLPVANFENQPGVGLAIRKQTLRRRGLIAEAAVRPPAGFPPSSRPCSRTTFARCRFLPRQGETGDRHEMMTSLTRVDGGPPWLICPPSQARGRSTRCIPSSRSPWSISRSRSRGDWRRDRRA